MNDNIDAHRLSLDHLSFNDEEDIFKCDNNSRSSPINDDALINNCIIGIQPVIRPRSISTSANFHLFPSSGGIDLRGGSILQEQQQQNKINRSPTANLQAASERARLVDEHRNQDLSSLLAQHHQFKNNNNLDQLLLSSSSTSATTNNFNSIGFRERAAHTFSIPTSNEIIMQHQQLQRQIQQLHQLQQQNSLRTLREKP